MKCVRCNRPLKSARILIGKQAIGPVCAKRVGISAPQKRKYLVGKHIKPLDGQMGLFAGVVAS